MVLVFNSVANLINSMIEINSTWVKKVSDTKSNKLPISCKYFLTLIDIQNDNEIKDFFSYINDETRTIEFPFIKNNHIDYSMMLEMEQFYNIELVNNIKDISKNIDEFIDIVKESNGKIVFILDIEYLLNLMVKFKLESNPNHLIDMILHKLSNSNIPEITEIYILDKQSTIKNKSNLLYNQLDICIKKNKNKIENKNIIVYKDIDESLLDNIYWNILEEHIKISSYIGKIKSPYDDTYFNLMKIDEKNYFVKQIDIMDCIDKNLFNLDNNPGIIINPIDRLFI